MNETATVTAPSLLQRVTRPTLRAREAFFGILFVAPQAIGYLVFLLGPIAAI